MQRNCRLPNPSKIATKHYLNWRIWFCSIGRKNRIYLGMNSSLLFYILILLCSGVYWMYLQEATNSTKYYQEKYWSCKAKVVYFLVQFDWISNFVLADYITDPWKVSLPIESYSLSLSLFILPHLLASYLFKGRRIWTLNTTSYVYLHHLINSLSGEVSPSCAIDLMRKIICMFGITLSDMWLETTLYCTGWNKVWDLDSRRSRSDNWQRTAAALHLGSH